MIKEVGHDKKEEKNLSSVPFGNLKVQRKEKRNKKKNWKIKENLKNEYKVPSIFTSEHLFFFSKPNLKI